MRTLRPGNGVFGRSQLPALIAIGVVLLVAPGRVDAQIADSGAPSACTPGNPRDGERAAAPRDSGTFPGPRQAAADTSRPAIRLLVGVHADELTFARSPRVCVRLSGAAQLDSVHVLGRRNIATPVVAAHTYRDVDVAVEIIGRLNADCITAGLAGSTPDSARTRRCATINAGVRPATASPRR